ncbi:hypothetical protein [Haloplanus halobius]|uniref:Nmad2 family putative nucleotide modification protein n=1 Tax=Haloplanus halobius TaxID=2934938 RepID=UPI00200FDDBE|nr:hypothetical protein [Haloplanus sp. XH21]
MQALLLRVGLDYGTGGGLAPIYDDGTFEYIPIPESYETTQQQTFGGVTTRDGRPYAEYVGSNNESRPLHLDPEFTTYTYGDPTRKRSQLAELTEDDLLIFYAGLKPKTSAGHPRLYVIGYFTVDAIHELDGKTPTERADLSDRLSNNAHIQRTKLTPESKHPDQDAYPVIVEGKPDQSRLLEKARPLTDAYVSGTNQQYHMLDSVARISGYSTEKDLTRASGRWLEPTDEGLLRAWLDDETTGLVGSDTRLYSYVLTHDSGFAPNVSHGYCTLATCKPKIRMNANVGDWVIGTGSLTRDDNEERLLYAMRVEEVLPYDEYFEREDFEYKKPKDSDLHDSQGDNIYYTGKPLGGERIEDSDTYRAATPDGDRIYYRDSYPFVQLDNPNHPPSRIKADTPNDPDRQAVLVSRQFWYFGGKEVHLPEDDNLREALIKGYQNPNGKIGQKKTTNEDRINQFVSWLVENYRIGVHSYPRDAGETDDHEHTNC